MSKDPKDPGTREMFGEDSMTRELELFQNLAKAHTLLCHYMPRINGHIMYVDEMDKLSFEEITKALTAHISEDTPSNG